MRKEDLPKTILGGIVVIGFFAILGYLISTGEYKSEVGLIVGALIGAFGTVIAFHFSSSQGSADKTQMLFKLGEKNKQG